MTFPTPPDKRPLHKQILPRTLLGRSLLIIVTPLVLLQVISTWVFFDRHYDTTTKRLAQGLAGDVAIVIQMMIRNPGSVERGQVFRLAQRSMHHDLTFVEDARLPQLPQTTPSDSFNIFTSLLERKLTSALEEIGRASCRERV